MSSHKWNSLCTCSWFAAMPRPPLWPPGSLTADHHWPQKPCGNIDCMLCRQGKALVGVEREKNNHSLLVMGIDSWYEMDKTLTCTSVHKYSKSQAHEYVRIANLSPKCPLFIYLFLQKSRGQSADVEWKFATFLDQIRVQINGMIHTSAETGGEWWETKVN